MADEDEEFLYGDVEMEDSNNTSANPKNDEAELYDLYGDDDNKEKEESPEKTTETQDTETEKPEADPPTAKSNEEEEGDSDSDDDLEIILEPEEETQTEAGAEQPKAEQPASSEAKEALVNIKPGQQAKSSAVPAANTFSNANQPNKAAQGGINLEGVGEYNGQPINEVNLDDFEDKPWRKPGADITDYFNYGFNEVTWRAYCAKQKMLRENKKLMGEMNMSDMNMGEMMNMSDLMSMGDVMSMGMMMPPNIMDGSMPMPMAGMPNPMMGMPMGMPGPPPPPGSSHPNGGGSMLRSSRNSQMGSMRSSTRDISMPRHSSSSRRSDSRERRKRSYDPYRRD
ncbi:Fip1 motif-domain-containing protein [Sporodiniella umbellata]|nr:Fip1 motif-domain-containing protein [Sporodiniella umbellata]